MPVQINELIIRANVTEGGANKAESNAPASDNASSGRDDIVKECVAIVMEILKSKNQR